MNREHVSFTCDGCLLIGTLDHGVRTTGLLIVSGGNETRSGPWFSQAQLAQFLASKGYPVFRFDRRGIGDSEGSNAGYQGSQQDILSAIDAFRRYAPHVEQVIGYGNCDAATALLHTKGLGLTGLILSNPWTLETEDGGLSPEAMRSHYKQRLQNKAALKRLLTGKVSVFKLVESLLASIRRKPENKSLFSIDMTDNLNAISTPLTFLIAERDRVGREFLTQWDKNDRRIRICPNATHSFVEPEAQVWWRNQILDLLDSEPENWPQRY